jgi:hypothetical protein
MTAADNRSARSRAGRSAGGGWPAVAIAAATALCLLEALVPAATAPQRSNARSSPQLVQRTADISGAVHRPEGRHHHRGPTQRRRLAADGSADHHRHASGPR